jgi:hypothetical protein
MTGHALTLGALWIATTSLCICEPNESKAVEFDYAEGPEAPMNSAVGLTRQVRVTVYVFDGSAQFLPGDLITAETLATKMFQKVGIQVMWVADASAANLLLRVWESSTVRGTRVTSDALGFRLSMSEAVVLSDATRKVAANWKVDPVLCLGLTIAHEMGHLLLQSETHSVSGVMKARWLRGDLAAAERGALTFTPQDGRSMRNGLRRLGTQVSQGR